MNEIRIVYPNKKSKKIKLIIGGIAAIVIIALLLRPAPMYKQIYNQLKEKESNRYRQVEEMLISEDRIKEDTPRIIQEAWDEYGYSSYFKVQLSRVAVDLQEYGFDPAAALQYVDEALEEVNYRYFKNLSDYELLNIVLSACSDRKKALLTCASKLDPEGKDLEQWETLVTNCYVRLFTDQPLMERLEAVSGIEDLGQSASVFKKLAFPELNESDPVSFLRGMSDPAEKRGLARLFAERYEETDAILDFLYTCRGMDVFPSDCYPNGVEIHTGLAKLPFDYNAPKDGEWKTNPKILAVRHYERDEPLEHKLLGITSISNDYEVPTHYSKDYDGNDKSLLESYQNILDTKLMDQIPVEYFPRSLEECTVLISLEGFNSFFGTMQYESHDITRKHEGLKVISETESTVGLKYEVPCYLYAQAVTIRDYPGALLLELIDQQVVFPDDIPEDFSSSKYGSVIDNLYDGAPEEFRQYTQGKPDEIWDEEIAQQVLIGIKEADWDIGKYLQRVEQ